MKDRIRKLGMLMLGTAVLLTACRLPNIGRIEKRNSSIKRPNEYGQIVIDAIKNKDAESIRNIMSPYIREHYSQLDKDINRMLDFIEGDIISYEGPAEDVGGAECDEKGYVEKGGLSNIHNIRTTVSGKYEVRVEITEVYRKNPEYEGVDAITIFNENGFKNGRYEDGTIFNLGYLDMWKEE